MNKNDGGVTSSANGRLSEAETALRAAKRKLIIYAVLTAACLAICVADTLLICFEAPLSDDAKVYIFLAGFVGLVCFAVQTIRQARLFIKTRRQSSQPQTVGVVYGGQNPAEDVTRIPIEFDDDAGKAELEEFTKNFLENIVFPEGFEDFLKDNEKAVFIRYYKDGGYDVDYIEMDGKYSADKIKDINLGLIVYTDDYYTQFRKVLFFADDESGHRHFLLDYGEGGEPKVKLLDNEFDEVELLADSFKEFSEDTVTPKEAHEMLGKNYYGYFGEEDGEND